MKYYLWVDAHDLPITPAFAYEDEVERMAEETRPPVNGTVLRTGTKEQLKTRYHLKDEEFID